MRNLCLIAAIEELARVGIREPVIARGAKHPQLRSMSSILLGCFTGADAGPPREGAAGVRGSGDPERLASRHTQDLAQVVPHVSGREGQLAEVERRLGIPDGWSIGEVGDPTLRL